MSIFNSLPILNKCCYCIGLRIGCFIIAILCVLSFGQYLYLDEYKNDDCFKGKMKFFGFASLVIAILVFIAAIYFIYGLIREISTPAEVFLWALLIMVLFNVAVLIYVIISSTTRKCSTSGPFSLGGASLIGALVLFYFMVIVNSYRLGVY